MLSHWLLVYGNSTSWKTDFEWSETISIKASHIFSTGVLTNYPTNFNIQKIQVNWKYVGQDYSPPKYHWLCAYGDLTSLKTDLEWSETIKINKLHFYNCTTHCNHRIQPTRKEGFRTIGNMYIGLDKLSCSSRCYHWLFACGSSTSCKTDLEWSETVKIDKSHFFIC